MCTRTSRDRTNLHGDPSRNRDTGVVAGKLRRTSPIDISLLRIIGEPFNDVAHRVINQVVDF
jgi:hypothetical protein